MHDGQFPSDCNRKLHGDSVHVLVPYSELATVPIGTFSMPTFCKVLRNVMFGIA
jgi:hypothetical protein